MRIDYIPGNVGSCSGFGFYGAPPHLFPANEAQLNFSVYFPVGYDWVKGGKLPGLFIGKPGASGGNWGEDMGSARVLFKQKGSAIAYVYVPTCICGGSQEAVPAALGPEYEAIVGVTNGKGHHLWKNKAAWFKTGQWNQVSIRVKMNTPGCRDGVIELTVNGVRQSFEKMVWRVDGGMKIGGINCVTFFGGSGPEAAAPPGAHTLFKDFSVWTR